MLILRADQLVLNAHLALTGHTPGNAVFAGHVALARAAGGEAAWISAVNAFVNANFGDPGGTPRLADAVIANLGLGAIVGIRDTVIAFFNTQPANRGGLAIQAADWLLTVTPAAGDTALRAAQTAFRAANAGAFNHSSNPANQEAAPTTPGSQVAGGGRTFTLTTATDILNGGTGNDTFFGDFATVGQVSPADQIHGGAGTDVLNLFGTFSAASIPSVITGVETVVLKSALTNADLNLSASFSKATNGVENLVIADAAALNTKTITIGAGQNLSLAGAATGGTVTVAHSATDTTANLTLNGYQGTGTEQALTSTGAATTTFNLVSQGALNKVSTLTLPATATTVNVVAATELKVTTSLAAEAATALNISGAGAVTIAGSNLAAAVTIDATKATGAVTFTGETAATSTTFNGGTGKTSVTTASTGTVVVNTQGGNDTVDVSGGNGTVTINTGAGNDRVLVGAQTNVTAADSINGGEGTDTIVITDATLNAATATALPTSRVAGFEIIETTAITAVTIDFNALSIYDTVVVSVAMAAGAAGGDAAGANSITATAENPDTLIVSAARVGQTGGAATAAGKDGGDGINFAPRIDGGANIATIRLVGNADITGGIGSNAAGANNAGSRGGDGLDAANIETLNLIIAGTQASTGTADTVTFAGGTKGAPTGMGAASVDGSSVVVGTNATINITSALEAGAGKHNHLDLGTVVGTNVTINAAAFEGNLTVTALTGNVNITGGNGADTITGGAGMDVLTGGAGADSITGGAGNDTIDGGAGNDIITGGTGVDIMTGGAGADRFVFAAGDNGTTPSATVFDAIQDYVSGTDIIDFGGTNIVQFATATTASATVAGVTAAGIVSFHADDDTLAERIVAVSAAIAGAGAGNALVFGHGADSYVFVTDGTSGLGANDVLIRLTGIASGEATNQLTIVGGDITGLN